MMEEAAYLIVLVHHAKLGLWPDGPTLELSLIEKLAGEQHWPSV